MTKTELAKKMAAELREDNIGRLMWWLDILGRVAGQALLVGEEVPIPGLGKLVKLQRKQTIGRDDAGKVQHKIRYDVGIKAEQHFINRFYQQSR